MKKMQFRAVSIVGKCGMKCAAAKSVQGVRYLCSHAPTLPLAGCENGKLCKCIYQHYDDRRDDLRRDSDAGIFGRSYFGPERRTVRGRRATDGMDWKRKSQSR